MFYLTEFFKSVGESLIRGLSFFLFSCLLAFSLTHRPWLTEMVEKVSPEKVINPYIVAVLDSSAGSKALKEKLSSLPGVLDISERSIEEGQQKIRALVEQLGPGYTVPGSMLSFKTLRISLNPALSSESLVYVRDQIVKMGGKDNGLNVTNIKWPEVTGLMKSHPFYAFLGKSGAWGIIGLIAICWVISFWLCYNVFRSRSYIIEKFQRKKFVAPKSIAAGLSLVVVMFGGLGLLNGTLKFLDILILMMVFSVFWTFSMQDWRWKPTL